MFAFALVIAFAFVFRLTGEEYKKLRIMSLSLSYIVTA